MIGTKPKRNMKNATSMKADKSMNCEFMEPISKNPGKQLAKNPRINTTREKEMENARGKRNGERHLAGEKEN